MEISKIKNISGKLSATINKTKTVSNHSNPFGVSFKGNIFKADVFESSQKNLQKSGLAEKVINKGRLAVNAIVGSINSVNQNISLRMNTIADFGRKMKEKTISAFKFLNEAKLVINLGTDEKLLALRLPDTRYSVENLMKLDTSKLREELVSTIAARG